MLLTFSSTRASFGHLTDELTGAIGRFDIPHVQCTAVRLALLGGEIILVRFLVFGLDRAVSFFFFAWSVG